MTTPAVEPLKEEVSKTLHKIIKNANKKDVEIKNNAQKALGMLVITKLTFERLFNNHSRLIEHLALQRCRVCTIMHSITTHNT